MFGDWNWISSRSDAQNHRLSDWLQELRNNEMQLTIIELGAGEAVPTVRWKSEQISGTYNGTLIRINPRDYNAPHGHISIPLGSAEAINQIYERIKSIQ